MVTVTAKGLATGNICAPDDGSWTELNGSMITKTAGAVTTSQATWYSFRPSASAETYTFTFETNCSASGTPLTTGYAATALAVRFTGVNPITPVDVDGTGAQIYRDQPGSGLTPGSADPGTTVNPDPVTPARSGDWVIAFYGTSAPTALTSSTCTTGNGYLGFSGGAGTATATGFCGKNSPPANAAYDLPSATAGSSQPWVAQTIALESAAGGCGSSCQYGMEDPGGVSTDYGLAIRAAETNLEALASTRPTAQKVIILLSDGDANTNPAGNGPLAPMAANYTPYPCSFGIQQAEAAELRGTWIFSIAYGATYGSGSCTMDAGSGAPSTYRGLSAQCAMILMANNSVSNAYNSVSNPSGYANDAAAKAALCPANVKQPSDPPHRFYNEETGTSLEDVFQDVGIALTSPRLISDDAT
jgi:hypothetical protein